MNESVGVAVVGGGLSGAATAARLAAAGEHVVVFERSLTWRWRAGGVFASPAAMVALRRVGLDDDTLETVARPIPAMRVETAAGVAFRLTYGADTGGAAAVGFDRPGLDQALLGSATRAGADLRQGWSVTAVDVDAGVLHIRRPDGSPAVVTASTIVGADGPHSVVAGSAGVTRPARLDRRVGLTHHLVDPEPTACRDARMVVFRDGYVGVAPVAGGRINIGIVLGKSWDPDLARVGARSVARAIVGSIPPADDDPAGWRTQPATDALAGASPLGHRVTRRTGRRWLLVGDAAGFLDPFTGEGIHRALVSAELGAAAILARRRGHAGAFDAYERTMQRRFLAKDAVSTLVQAFLARPAAFEYAARRLAGRPKVRATMGLVMGDLIPAERALDPRFLAALLAP